MGQSSFAQQVRLITVHFEIFEKLTLNLTTSVTSGTRKVTTGLTASQENYSDIFTPKNEEEVNFIWIKYKVEHPIWTDFTRVNTSSFYRQISNLHCSYPMSHRVYSLNEFIRKNTI